MGPGTAPPPQRRPAGQVLVSMLVAFAVAGVLGAERLERRVEAKAEGWQRSASVTLVRGVRSLAGAVGLDRPGEWIDQAVGDAREPAGAPAGTSAPAAGLPETRSTRGRPVLPGTRTARPEAGPATTVPAPAPLRPPTAEEPLRTWIGGDSLAQTFGESLLRLGQERGQLAGVTEARVSSGLVRPGYFDWPAHLGNEVLPAGYEVLVFMLGANDTHPLGVDGRIVEVEAPAWEAEYRRRVAVAMDLVGDADRALVWVGAPPLRDGDKTAKLAVINGAVAAEAASRPWVRFVDTAGVLVGPGGGYTAYLEVDGRPVRVREGDGIHLTRAGADLAAGVVLEAVADLWE